MAASVHRHSQADGESMQLGRSECAEATETVSSLRKLVRVQLKICSQGSSQLQCPHAQAVAVCNTVTQLAVPGKLHRRTKSGI